MNVVGKPLIGKFASQLRESQQIQDGLLKDARFRLLGSARARRLLGDAIEVGEPASVEQKVEEVYPADGGRPKRRLLAVLVFPATGGGGEGLCTLHMSKGKIVKLVLEAGGQTVDLSADDKGLPDDVFEAEFKEK